MRIPVNSPRLSLRRWGTHFRLWHSVFLVRLRLSIFGYASFLRSPVAAHARPSNLTPIDVARIVMRVSKFVPGALCLAQAITAQRELARLGYKTKMRIGVKPDSAIGIEAHAWLVYKEKVILGGSGTGLEDYEVIANLNSATT